MSVDLPQSPREEELMEMDTSNVERFFAIRVEDDQKTEEPQVRAEI